MRNRQNRLDDDDPVDASPSFFDLGVVSKLQCNDPYWLGYAVTHVPRGEVSHIDALGWPTTKTKLRVGEIAASILTA
jgi:hypothetical protein